LIDEKLALAALWKSGPPAGAALDVFVEEPRELRRWWACQSESARRTSPVSTAEASRGIEQK